MTRGNEKIDWSSIDWVLLDLDGTLLDKHFEREFWNKIVPKAYAEKKGITLSHARKELHKTFSTMKGRLKWYDWNYWSNRIGVPLLGLVMKYETLHLIRLHPDSIKFLKTVRSMGKRLVLVTNAHHGDLHVKLHRANIGNYFDAIVSSADLGEPKQSIKFWRLLEKSLGFDKHRTILVDDEEKVLRTADDFGIRWIACRTTSKGARIPAHWITAYNFSRLTGSNL